MHDLYVICMYLMFEQFQNRFIYFAYFFNVAVFNEKLAMYMY